MAGWQAEQILNAIEEWDDRYWLLRETGCFVEGRVDGLLIPTRFDAHCLKKGKGHWTERMVVCGIEVKASRQDFIRGKKSGQFDRYAKTLSGLYVATFRDTCRTSEIPSHCGHLVYTHEVRRTAAGHRQGIVVCKRHPKYKRVEFTQEQMWDLFISYVGYARTQEQKERQRVHRVFERMGARAAGEVFATLREMRKAVEQEVSQGNKAQCAQNSREEEADDALDAGGLGSTGGGPDLHEGW